MMGTLADPAKPHQIVVTTASGGARLAVSCNCLRQPGGSHKPLETRLAWQPGEAVARWRQHMTDLAAAVPA